MKPCGWCEQPIPATARRDAIYCSKRCRQAAHRVASCAPGRRGGRRVALRSSTGPLRLAYADPPYPGLARRYYRDHPDFGGEVDHAELIARLVREYPDGWALSTSAAALPGVLALCPPDARVAAWFRGERPVKSLRPLSAWEPVVYVGGRAVVSPLQERRLDALIHRARPRTTDPRRVIGSKPAAFAYWMFGLLGALPGDELVDLFPGSGIVARCWAHAGSAQGALDPSLVAIADPRDTSRGDVRARRVALAGGGDR
jgi:hypothetical protein